MPRQRMVKPDFFDSESLGMCSIAARLAFIGLWVTSDDYGNQKAQAGKLKLRIFPYDPMTEESFTALLCELEEVGCIKGYEIDGSRYINIPNFQIYQTVRKPSKTSIPEPPKATEKAKRTTVIHQWYTSDAPVASYEGSTAPLQHQYDTSDPERKKEGKKEGFFPKGKKPSCAEHGADAGKPAPRSARKCQKCGGEMRPTNSFVSGTRRRIWRCAECDGEEAVDE